MEGRFSSVAMRVPTLNVSAIDMVVNVREATDVAAVNPLLKNAANGSLKAFSATPTNLTSSDFNHDATPAVDGGQTRVTGGTMVQCCAGSITNGVSLIACWMSAGVANRNLKVKRGLTFHPAPTDKRKSTPFGVRPHPRQQLHP